MLHLYHPNRHDQIIAVKGAKTVRHAENGIGVELRECPAWRAV